MKAKMKKSIYVMLSFALVASGLVFVSADVDATDTDQVEEVETVEGEEETVDEEKEEVEEETEVPVEEAAEDTEEIVEETKETAEETKENRANGTAYVSNYTELLQAINNDENVMLTDSFKLEKTVKIPKNQSIIINGAYTLDSPDDGKHFEVSSNAKLTINNVILNGKDVGGGATWAMSGGVRVNGTFDMNSGKIQNGTGYGYNGTGIGVSVAPDGTFNMYGGSIENNTAHNQGGAGVYAYEGTVNIHGGTISNNKNTDITRGNGAGISVRYSTLNIDGGTIENNQSGTGGGISADDKSVVNIKNGIIRNNTASYNGGGLYIRDSKLNISGSSQSVKIQNNKSWETTWKDNYTEGGGGIYALADATVKIEDDSTEITGNTTNKYGGGIFVGSTSKLELGKENTISGNTAMNGGGIYVAGSEFTMKGSTIENNKVARKGNMSTVALGGYGGGICVGMYGDYSYKDQSTVTITGGKIINNEAEYEGGGLKIGSATFNMTGGVVEGNKAKNAGGIDISSTNLSGTRYRSKAIINGSSISISNNEATSHGGGITISESDLTMTSATVSGNTAGIRGGGLFESSIQDTKYNLIDTKFTNNYAGEDGGGIYTPTHTKLVIQNGYFKDNKAGNGGFAFDIMKDTTLKSIYDAQVTVTSLSDPFSLTNTDESMTYAYNNHDVNYRSTSYPLSFDGNGSTGGQTPQGRRHFKDNIVTVEFNPNNLTRTGYTFLGWSEDKDTTTPTYDETNNTFVMPAEHVTLYAIWQINSYTVIFQDKDGTELSKETVHYGDAAAEATKPTKAADAKYTYTFDKWVPSGTYSIDELGNVTQDMVFVASYTKTVNQYTVIFKDEDGTELSKETVDYGYKVIEAKHPTKAADDKYTYTFDKWVPSGTYSIDELGNVTQDMIFVASYTATEIKVPTDPTPGNSSDDEGEVLGETVVTEKGTNQGTNVQTSDSTKVVLYSLGTMIAFISVIYISRKRKTI